MIFLNKIKKILNKIIKNNGKPYLVGGTVRDIILKKKIKDIDIEIHNISLKKLENILKSFGTVKLVGKQFGVLRLENYDIDWSLPRSDSSGRKPTVKIDINMGIKKACKRRDLTINSMAVDLSKINKPIRTHSTSSGRTGLLNTKFKIIDYYGGLKDIKNKKLRAINKNLFIQDPLRFYRVMQFIGRFEFSPDKQLNNICKKISLKISKERIYQEIKKLFLKSKKPSLGFRWLKKIDRLKETFPELNLLINLKQRKDYHPEGDVFEHTMQTLDASANLKKYKDQEEKFLIMLACLCHDLGKITTTDKDFHCFGHEMAGIDFTKKLLKKFISDKTLIKKVCKLVKYHTRPFLLIKQKAKDKSYKKLANKLAPTLNLKQLAFINLCDIRGRNPKNHKPFIKKYEKLYNNFIKKVEKIGVKEQAVKPILMGRDLIEIIKPGPLLGQALKQAYKIQIDQNITDKNLLKNKIIEIFLNNQS